MVNASMITNWTTDSFTQLTRASHDAEVAVACLIAYWVRADIGALYWCLRATTDVVFAFKMLGTGSKFQIAKFGTDLRHLRRAQSAPEPKSVSAASYIKSTHS